MIGDLDLEQKIGDIDLELKNKLLFNDIETFGLQCNTDSGEQRYTWI